MTTDYFLTMTALTHTKADNTRGSGEGGGGGGDVLTVVCRLRQRNFVARQQQAAIREGTPRIATPRALVHHTDSTLVRELRMIPRKSRIVCVRG